MSNYKQKVKMKLILCVSFLFTVSNAFSQFKCDSVLIEHYKDMLKFYQKLYVKTDTIFFNSNRDIKGIVYFNSDEDLNWVKRGIKKRYVIAAFYSDECIGFNQEYLITSEVQRRKRIYVASVGYYFCDIENQQLYSNSGTEPKRIYP